MLLFSFPIFNPIISPSSIIAVPRSQRALQQAICITDQISTILCFKLTLSWKFSMSSCVGQPLWDISFLCHLQTLLGWLGGRAGPRVSSTHCHESTKSCVLVPRWPMWPVPSLLLLRLPVWEASGHLLPCLNFPNKGQQEPTVPQSHSTVVARG